MAEPKSPPTVAELNKLAKQLADGREAAKNAILESITKEVAELKELGFEYSLVEGGAQPKKRMGRPPKAQALVV